MSESRWQQFSRSEQVAAVGAELMRAAVWEKSDKGKYELALERAMKLVDRMLDDAQKWKRNYFMLLFLRQELGKFYIGEAYDITALYNTL